MAEALQLTRAGRLTEATALLQQGARGGSVGAVPLGAPHVAPVPEAADPPLTHTEAAGSRSYRLHVPVTSRTRLRSSSCSTAGSRTRPTSRRERG